MRKADEPPSTQQVLPVRLQVGMKERVGVVPRQERGEFQHAGGIVPDSFRIVRQLISRIEEEATGKVLTPEFYETIPDARLKQASATAAVLGAEIYSKFPSVKGAGPVSTDPTELILNRAWRPALTVIGADGLPPTGNAGNVLRASVLAQLACLWVRHTPALLFSRPALRFGLEDKK